MGFWSLDVNLGLEEKCHISEGLALFYFLKYFLNFPSMTEVLISLFHTFTHRR